MGNARYGHGRYGHTSYGTSRRQYRGFDAPWFIKTRTRGIRVDGLASGQPLSPVVPGQTITYECRFLPQPARGDSADDHLERYRAARELLGRAPDVVVYDPPGTTAAYREQHGAADGTQLVAIGPLAPASDGSAPAGQLPPVRDSVHDPRWAVVVGGGSIAPRPRKQATVTLEATTIAATSTYGSRQAVRDEREYNGF